MNNLVNNTLNLKKIFLYGIYSAFILGYNSYAMQVISTHYNLHVSFLSNAEGLSSLLALTGMSVVVFFYLIHKYYDTLESTPIIYRSVLLIMSGFLGITITWITLTYIVMIPLLIKAQQHWWECAYF